MKKLILHVGLHKTASSSIQVSLAKNKQLLEQSGILFPMFKGLDGIARSNHSAGVYSLFCDNPSEFRLNIVNQWDAEKTNANFLQQLQQSMFYDGQLLISGESISTLTKNELKKLKSFFRAYDIRVICFVREAYEYQCSAIQEQIKDGIDCLSDLRFRKTANRVENIKSIFPNTEFYSFDQACKYERGPVYFFLNLLGIDNTETFIENKTNESLGFHSTRLLNYINMQQPMVVNGSVNLFRKSLSPADLMFDNHKFSLYQHELQKMLPDIIDENSRLEKLTGIVFPSKALTAEAHIPPTEKELRTLARLACRHPDEIQSYISKYLIENNFTTLEQWHDLTPKNLAYRTKRTLKNFKAYIKAKVSRE